MSDTFKCSRCKETFKKGWTDEEAEAELKENFPGYEIEDCDVLCEDCFNKTLTEGHH